uniref:Fungal lipase-type domain-containing protein n=1 Tax=Kalanchoe fedtschenkoi TaxID=63787 RepID=A0A7N0VLU5_KALFE
MGSTSTNITGTSFSYPAEEAPLRKPLFRSPSARDLFRATLRRSVSDPHLCYNSNRICATSARPKIKSSPSVGTLSFQFLGSIFPKTSKSLFDDSIKSRRVDVVEHENTDEIEEAGEEEGEKKVNWIQRVLEIRSQWLNKQEKQITIDDTSRDGEDGGVCEVSYDEDEGEEMQGSVSYDNTEAFSGLLTRVGLSDTKHLSRLAFLCNLAYRIPQIKAKDLRRNHGLRFVTSSLEKKAEAAKTLLEQDSVRVPKSSSLKPNFPDYQQQCLQRPSVAHHIAASAASYVQSRAKGLLSIGSVSLEGETEDHQCTSNFSKKQEEDSSSGMKDQEVAAYIAAATMTAVVAAGEKEKQEAANDLQSLHSSPCDWFICDDYSTYTRCFVIQGSDSFTSWQANLFFEPTQFEDSEALVHRGIYEAAKGTLKQFMPYILDHISRFGDRAKFQFTGHSLGGSLSLLIQLMLVGRKIVDSSTLRPVVTFGSPFVFCGGQKLLEELGLDENNVHCVMMHRDIVPRAFSCDYPDRVAQLLKRVNGTFRSLPCLSKNKLLYAPLGKIFIVQPDESSSPPHPLLPQGSALYYMDKTKCKSMSSAVRAFMNSPHPLQTLSKPTAYKPGGTILRDHDSGNYLSAITGILYQHTKLQMEVQKVAIGREQVRWPQLIPPPSNTWSHEGGLDKAVVMRKRIISGA